MNEKKHFWNTWFFKQRILKPHLFVKDVIWWIRHRTTDRFDVVYIKSLKPGYHDKDEMMLHVCFDLLVDFVEREKPLECIEYFLHFKSEPEIISAANDMQVSVEYIKESQHIGREIQSLYDWWTKERSLKYAALEANEYEFKAEMDLEDENQANLFKAALNIEAEDQTNLKRLIDIRECLWT